MGFLERIEVRIAQVTATAVSAVVVLALTIGAAHFLGGGVTSPVPDPTLGIRQISDRPGADGREWSVPANLWGCLDHSSAGKCVSPVRWDFLVWLAMLATLQTTLGAAAFRFCCSGRAQVQDIAANLLGAAALVFAFLPDWAALSRCIGLALTSG